MINCKENGLQNFLERLFNQIININLNFRSYINVLQNSNLSWELTLIRIEDELEQIKTNYKLKIEQDVIKDRKYWNFM